VLLAGQLEYQRMSTSIERALRRRCAQDDSVKLLEAQWDYDKRLVAQALQGIIWRFPHYSLHDASHSNAILTQIARVLGEARIALLGATDLWLLLEAAYHHDIGMVVTDEQAREWWATPDFHQHLRDCASGSDEEFADAARWLQDKYAAFEPGSPWPIQTQRAWTLVLAEYARKQHPRRAKDIVGQPGQLGLESPRTRLIPARLVDLLGRICEHHGKNFQDIFDLPACENGLGMDDAHPRFVAAMLRLGDLLDLDNGRFCPVMGRLIGGLPASSVAHEEKHAAIRHFRVSPARIEVDAECADYPSYEAAGYWFDMLREELQELGNVWNEFAPVPEFGGPPGRGEIVARLRDHVPLKGGQQFKVDREAFLKLARGTNLYSSSATCIRELLQNAVDATLLRLWKEMEDPAELLDVEDPIERLKKKLALSHRYPHRESAAAGFPERPGILSHRTVVRGVACSDHR
jgi:hypothetical protein